MPRMVALVPMRHVSQRVPGKNYRMLGGRPLYHHILTRMLSCPEISEVVVDTDSPTIMEGLQRDFPQVTILERPNHLRAGEVPMNEVLLHDTAQVEAGFYLQTHSTNPLLLSETISRTIRRIQRNIQSAAFPMQAAFEDIDFSPARSLDRRSILELGQCHWITSRHNLLVLGPPGSGKSFIASAFGHVAARHGFTVRYQRTSRLLHALSLARTDGSFTALLRSLAKINLLIIDDWIRDPITLANAQDILEVLDDRFGHTATLIASQVPVSDWHLRIPDPTLADAILDRRQKQSNQYT